MLYVKLCVVLTLLYPGTQVPPKCRYSLALGLLPMQRAALLLSRDSPKTLLLLSPTLCPTRRRHGSFPTPVYSVPAKGRNLAADGVDKSDCCMSLIETDAVPFFPESSEKKLSMISPSSVLPWPSVGWCYNAATISPTARACLPMGSKGSQKPSSNARGTKISGADPSILPIYSLLSPG